jgi:LmbE family N-acetylglucosaminyl deacetylase
MRAVGSVDENTPVIGTQPGFAAELWRPLLDAAPELPTPWPAPGSPPGCPVTVVVPHPSDEALGAGGFLSRVAAAGSPVTVVYASDGTAAYRDLNAAQARLLADLRRREAVAALAALGLPDVPVVFLDLPDGAMPEREGELAERLAPLLARAELGLVPWPEDPHPDHRAVGRAARRAGRGGRAPLWEYPIWMRHSIRPSAAEVPVDRLRVLRLSEAELAAKQAAVAEHHSQLVPPFPGREPALSERAREPFADGREPYFAPL